MPIFRVIAQRAAVFADPLALYIEADPDRVEIVERIDRGTEFAGKPIWRKLPNEGIKTQWIARETGGYVLPDCVRRI